MQSHIRERRLPHVSYKLELKTHVYHYHVGGVSPRCGIEQIREAKNQNGQYLLIGGWDEKPSHSLNIYKNDFKWNCKVAHTSCETSSSVYNRCSLEEFSFLFMAYLYIKFILTYSIKKKNPTCISIIYVVRIFSLLGKIPWQVECNFNFNLYMGKLYIRSLFFTWYFNLVHNLSIVSIWSLTF